MSGDGLTPDVPYEYAAIAPPGSILFTAGACPLDHDGVVVAPGDPAAQADRTVDNLLAVLARHGAGPEHLVRTTVYVVGARGGPRGGVGRGRGAARAGTARRARSSGCPCSATATSSSRSTAWPPFRGRAADRALGGQARRTGATRGRAGRVVAVAGRSSPHAGSITGNRSSRRSNTTWPSARASAAPRQKWMPAPKLIGA